MQMAIHVGLTRDVMGPACVPVKARMAIKAPSHAAATSRFLECPVDFGRKQNRLVYRAEWLDKAPQLANSITVVEVSAACGKLLQEFQWTGGFTQRVYQELTRFPGRFPLIDSVASALQMNARTLRRRLADEGTSYRAVLEGVRRTLAIEYLRNSAMNSDDIASALGFSDSASFRHTFRRWTGKSPTRFRDEPFR
jgi:AraC-like DNA-binding protein